MQKRLPVFTLLLGCLTALRPSAAQTGQQALDLIGYSSKSFEMRLKKLLLHNYDATSRPVINDKDNITALVGISLYHILDTVRSTYLPLKKTPTNQKFIKILEFSKIPNFFKFRKY